MKSPFERFGKPSKDGAGSNNAKTPQRKTAKAGPRKESTPERGAERGGTGKEPVFGRKTGGSGGRMAMHDAVRDNDRERRDAVAASKSSRTGAKKSKLSTKSPYKGGGKPNSMPVFDPTAMPKNKTEMRLNRFVAQSGICSRRDADALISAGRVQVNGKVITEMGFQVHTMRDKVQFDGKNIQPRSLVYILLNKPKNFITTTDDPEGRSTVLDLVKTATNERVYPVGRLDRNTTGLLLLTNDGDLAERLMHPSHKVRKIYMVRLNRKFEAEDMEKILGGIQLEDGPAQVDKISYVEGRDMDEVGVEIHSGRNRIVRRMFEALGYSVEALDRTLLGPLTKKNIPRGKWRILTDKEVNFLRMM